jgi:hypothetical protein
MTCCKRILKVVKNVQFLLRLRSSGLFCDVLRWSDIWVEEKPADFTSEDSLYWAKEKDAKQNVIILL